MSDAGARPNEPEHLVVGQISKAHGTKGEVVVWPLTDSPERVFVDKASVLLGDVDGHLDPRAIALHIESVRPFKEAFLVKFAGFSDRAVLEKVLGTYLLAPRDSLPPLDEGEVFYHQLLGSQVSTVDGADVGVVREVFDTEPTHLLEVKSSAGKVHLIPFAAHIVRSVDVEGRRIVIDPPAGLLEI
jgi:16S rRNA processing protein RimM